MVNDSLTAYDLQSGEQLWRFYADGPVRLAPVAWREHVYFAADDGYLYCLAADRGTLCWRMRGGPYDRRVLGCERLISTWPVHGGPVLADGTLYFTAGIWPFMGIFVRAVDAASGQQRWSNTGAGADFVPQPHNSRAFGGFAPRGYLAVGGDTLVASGGRTQPACYDLHNGALRFFAFGLHESGTWQAGAQGDWYFNGVQMFSTADGHSVLDTPGTLHDAHWVFALSGNHLLSQKLELVAPQSRNKAKAIDGNIYGCSKKTAKKDAPQKTAKRTTKSSELAKSLRDSLPVKPGGENVKEKSHPPHSDLVFPPPLSLALPAGLPDRLFLKAGPRFVLGGKGTFAIVEANAEGKQCRLISKGNLAGDPWDMLVADGRLVVVNTSGQIFCFRTGRDGRAGFGRCSLSLLRPVRQGKAACNLARIVLVPRSSHRPARATATPCGSACHSRQRSRPCCAARPCTSWPIDSDPARVAAARAFRCTWFVRCADGGSCWPSGPVRFAALLRQPCGGRTASGQKSKKALWPRCSSLCGLTEARPFFGAPARHTGPLVLFSDQSRRSGAIGRAGKRAYP